MKQKIDVTGWTAFKASFWGTLGQGCAQNWIFYFVIMPITLFIFMSCLLGNTGGN